MVNSWSLLYDEMYGPDDEENLVKWKKENPGKSDYYFDYDRNDSGMPNPFSTLSDNDDQIAHHVDASADTLNLGPLPGPAAADTVSFDNVYVGSGVKGAWGQDHISLYNSAGVNTATDPYPTAREIFLAGTDPYPTVGSMNPVQDDVDDVYKFHFPGTETVKKPEPDLKNPAVQKYKEDAGIKDLKDYVSSTYQGHYTNENSDVQTLDLIHSVGDAESFCRSNALKYLSRYDKKGQAKRDILKAMHYCLLLYYFSGNANDETPTRGYETF